MILEDLKQNNPAAKSRACYRFGAVLLSWYLSAAGPEQRNRKTPYSGIIRRITDEMGRLPLEILDTPSLAERAGLGPCRFVQVFKLETGMTPKAYYDRSRFDLACRFLRTSRMGLDLIADRLHFSSAYHFSRFFKKFAGVPPRDYRRE
jgi:transcriptional regulator GlxA family with amidase domain